MKTMDSEGFHKTQKLPRKLRKILVEKKRRERIDGCLKEIKELLFRGTEFQNDYMRMEKADILENVVEFLKSQNLDRCSTKRSAEYKSGYLKCLQEVLQVLDNVCGQNTTTLSLKQYMSNKLNNILNSSTPVTANQTRVPPMTSHQAPATYSNAHAHRMMSPSHVPYVQTTNESLFLSSPYMNFVPRGALPTTSTPKPEKRPKREPNCEIVVPDSTSSNNNNISCSSAMNITDSMKENSSSVSHNSTCNSRLVNNAPEVNNTNNSSLDMWRPW